MWNPWRGCEKCSDGCLYCYIHKGDAKRGVDTSIIEKTKDFAEPIERLKNGNYKMKSDIVYTCFSTDFLIEEADEWRPDCWQMMREREDCTFLFLTKRIDRFMDCIPDDWGDGYENVVVCCTTVFQTVRSLNFLMITQPISAINSKANSAADALVSPRIWTSFSYVLTRKTERIPNL